MLVWQAFRSGFGSIPELTKLIEKEDGVVMLNDFFICAKEQNIKDKKEHGKQNNNKQRFQ